MEGSMLTAATGCGPPWPFSTITTPVYLSTKTEPMCSRNGCEVPDTKMWSGAVLRAICQIQGYDLTNADTHSVGIENNPNAVTSSRWYRVEMPTGVTGYIAEAYPTPPPAVVWAYRPALCSSHYNQTEPGVPARMFLRARWNGSAPLGRTWPRTSATCRHLLLSGNPGRFPGSAGPAPCGCLPAARSGAAVRSPGRQPPRSRRRSRRRRSSCIPSATTSTWTTDDSTYVGDILVINVVNENNK